jgi:hypothetical protein
MIWQTHNIEMQAVCSGIFLSGFQMGYDVGLGGCWPAGYFLAYPKII